MAGVNDPNEDSIHIIDFFDEYKKDCSERQLPILPSLSAEIQDAIDNGEIPKALKLNGSKNPDLKTAKSRIDNAYVGVIFRSLANNCFLSIIDLSYNEIGDAGAEKISAFLMSDTRVVKMILKSNNIGPKGGAAIGKALMINETIQEFDISYNAIENSGMDFAASLQVNTSLKKLILEHCNLSTNAIIALATVFRTSRTVNTLSLSNNENNFSRLTQSCANDIMLHLSKMVLANRGVEVLGFAKMGISDFMMVEHLAPAILENKKLARLDLSCNKFTRDGGVAICQALYKQQYLTHLNLSCCAIQDEGAEAVSVMLTYNKTLTTLFLDHNKIKGKGLRNIANAILLKNRTLRCITLWGNLWDLEACNDFAPLVGGPRNIDKENLSSDATNQQLSQPQTLQQIRSTQFAQQQQATTINADPNKARLHPKKVDFCFYIVQGVLNVCRNEDMHNRDFVCEVSL